MKRGYRMLLIGLVGIIALVALGGILYLQHPKFGKAPSPERQAVMAASPNYKDGKFFNAVETPIVLEQNRINSFWNFLFGKKERPAPIDLVPVQKTNLKELNPEENVVIWLGHSSYFIQMDGKRILIDPVLNWYASPIPYTNVAFPEKDPYTAADMPEIDYLLISHDHWDHLDYPTIMELKPKVGQVICGLGVGAYFEQWGFSNEQIHEADWYGKIDLEKDFSIYVLPARHFSGRLLERNKTLWVGFGLVSPDLKIFFSGDSGYSPHFKEIGEYFGGFDLVILENGQYDPKWPYIHMAPEETAQAAKDLNGKRLLPAHSGKFALANHPWDEPYKRLSAASEGEEYALATPMIGEPVWLDGRSQIFTKWWETIQ